MLRSTMDPRLQRLAMAALFLTLGACSSLRGLDEDPPPLSAAERGRVESKVDEALEDSKWTAAWNQAVDAGADRTRLESVALATLQDDDGDAEEMFEALTVKWGGLTPATRASVRALVERQVERKDWERAVGIEILTADDAPAYTAAWALYDRTPPYRAEAVLGAITDARVDREKAD